MASISKPKPHAVCIPYPAQGHINPMFKLAKLLHRSGFLVTFVNTDHNHRRLIRSHGAASVSGLPGFRFEAIPDGLQPSDADATQDLAALCVSIPTACLEPFCDLIEKLNASAAAPVSCIVSDGVMSFTLKAAERFGLPEVMFWSASACGLLGYMHYKDLIHKGYIPLQDMSQMTNGYLETRIEWIPGMKNIRLADIPTFIRTTNIDDIYLNFMMQETAAMPRAKALIINTFSAFERDALAALSSSFPKIYTIGPLHLTPDDTNAHDQPFTSSLWKEEAECIAWLDTMAPASVVYVNFGSITVVTANQMTEFAWGLANSKKPFLWIIRPDIVSGEAAMLPPEFLTETKDNCMMVSWCPQEEVLKHPAVGGFLTHGGWNSTLESVVGGVPVIFWPFFAEQQTNCRYGCVEWGIGMEIDNDVKRDEVELLVREMMMDGEKWKEMRKNVVEWKRNAEESVAVDGSSFLDFKRLIEEELSV
ncbi:UDP-glycosyltransferase 85A8-like [Salvia splendens]|uniref:UDP-glycosyltransferase 85A8-like n=1 Tax=Salvia splendens TaxID=180675 RepID=UPI001C2782E1|nr:UDP-glycosyltransferase 85A8-like [Salvia splendens]